MSVTRKGPPLTLGALLGIVAVAGVVGIVAITLPSARHEARLAGGGSQIKNLHIVTHLYAKEHDDVLPPLDAQAGRLMVDRDSIYPEYLRDVRMLVAAGDQDLPLPVGELPLSTAPPDEKHKRFVDDHSYIYLGYALGSEPEGLAWVDAYRRQAEAGGAFDKDLSARAGAGSLGTDRFYRLRNDFCGFLENQGTQLGAGAIPDAQIPVFVERPGHYPHRPGGWIVFLDGHAEYVAYPGKFPMTKKFIEALESLDALEKDTE